MIHGVKRSPTKGSVTFIGRSADVFSERQTLASSCLARGQNTRKCLLCNPSNSSFCVLGGEGLISKLS